MRYFIQDQFKKLKPAQKLVALKCKGEAPNISLGEAFKKYADTYPFDQGALYRKRHAVESKNCFESIHKKKISEILVSDVNKVIHAKQKIYSRGTISRLVSTLIHVIRFVVDGEEAKFRVDNSAVKIKHGIISVAEAHHIIQIYRKGRFADLLTEIKVQAENLKNGQAYIFRPKDYMDEKENKNIRQAVWGMFKKIKLPFVIRWSEERKSFVIFREDDFKQPGGK